MKISLVLKNKTIIELTDVSMFTFTNGTFDYYDNEYKNHVVKEVILINFIKEA